MNVVPPLWGFVGLFAGAWKLALVAAVAVAFFGRASRMKAAARMASSLMTRRAPPPRRARFNDRVFVFLLVIAATAVASTILGRLWIMQAVSGPETPTPQPSSPPEPGSRPVSPAL